MKVAQLCPKCGGAGKVSKPPYLTGDQNTWLDNQTGGYRCNLCNGNMVIYVEQEEQFLYNYNKVNLHRSEN